MICLVEFLRLAVPAGATMATQVLACVATVVFFAWISALNLTLAGGTGESPLRSNNLFVYLF